MHVKRGRIGGAGLNQAMLLPQSYYAALVVRVEDPHDAPPLKILDAGCILPRRFPFDQDDKGEAG